MISNLPENFLYEKLPEGILSMDERGLIRAVVGGYQDRVEDLRSYTRKLNLAFQASGLPEVGNNVVLVDLLTPDGHNYTRSLDILSSTPADGTPELAIWAAAQLKLDFEQVANARYGADSLRLVDADTRDFLAVAIGAVIYHTASIQSGEEDAVKTRLLASYFPRLKIKGTAQSFEILGRILGFSDVRMTPLFGRLSAHLPNDIGSPLNVDDFKSEPDFYPQQAINAFYDPHRTNDGPFYAWSGTASHELIRSDFVTQALNGFQPFVKVLVLNSFAGTVVPPEAGVYELSGGGPQTKAQVDAGGLRLQALADGEWFNGIKVAVAVNDDGHRVYSITDRLSSIKYRSSYFDLTLGVDFDRAEEVFGTSAVRSNPDLKANPSLTTDGTAVSPYRPWYGGEVTTGYQQEGFLVESSFTPVVTNGTDRFDLRVQAAGTVRQHNMDAIMAAGVQVASALEEVRPATRQPFRTRSGFYTSDDAIYARYVAESVLIGIGTVPPTSAEVDPSLNYTAFKNWTVSGQVDLIGAGPTMTLFDLVPGNGLYVDIVGSPQPGAITSKLLVIPAGTYAFGYYLAGNQRDNTPGYSIQATVGSYSGFSLLQTLSNGTVVINDWKQPFTSYSDTFIMQQNGTVRLKIANLNNPGSSFGLLVDRISLNTNLGAPYFFDSFDTLGTATFAFLDGTSTNHPLSPYRVEFSINGDSTSQALSHETDANDESLLHIKGHRTEGEAGTLFGVEVTGQYDYSNHHYRFEFPFGLPYNYEVIAHWTPTSTEVVRPEPVDATTVLAIVGDPHENNTGERASAGMVLGWNPHAIMVVGDSGLPTAADNIGDTMAPYVGYRDAAKLFSTIGNHDYSPTSAGTSLTAYLGFYNNLPGNGRYYSKRVGDVEMFVYNMGWNSNLALPLNQTSTLEPDGIDEFSVQGTWLKSALANSTAKWKLVFIHFEPYGSFLVNATRYPGYTASRLPFKAWGADMVFSGHIHAYERVLLDDVHYVTCGWSGHPQLRVYEKIGPVIPGSVVRFPIEGTTPEYGAVRLSANDATLVMEAWTVNGRLVDSLKLEKSSDTMYGYQGRPEDDVDFVEVSSNGSNLYPHLELADDYPWRRAIVGGGEDVDATMYVTTEEDAGELDVSETTSVVDQSGVDYNVYAVDSRSGFLRVVYELRPYDAAYEPGQPSVGYVGSIKDLSVYTDEDRALQNSKTDNETVFGSGFAIYHIGLVNGVLVADPQKFNRAAHRDGLTGWMPFNEHVDDDLEPFDRSAFSAPALVNGLVPSDRLWDINHGWHLNIRPGTVLTYAGQRASDAFSFSVWLARVTGTGVSTVFEYGPVSLDLDSSLNLVAAYVKDLSGVRRLVASHALSYTLRQFTFRMDATGVFFGTGDLTDSVVETGYFGEVAALEEDAFLTLQGGNQSFLIHDLRLWDVAKSVADFDAVRYHQPQPTVASYRLGVYYTLNRGDRYAMRVLPNGKATPAKLPPWIRQPKLKRIFRYDSMGRYHGEERFREVGLGGGRDVAGFPVQAKLGNQFINVTATGTAVAASNLGYMPGVNATWLNDRPPGQFISVSTGTLIPKGSEWRYLDDGTDKLSIGTPYYATAYNDGTWKSGYGYLGYGDGDEHTTISYGSNPAAKYVTSYFRKRFVVTDMANVGPLELGVRRDDGAVVYINGVEVFRTNMSAGAYTYTTFSATTVNNDPTYYTKILPQSVLTNGTNYIAVDVHQRSLTSSDLAFDAYLIVTGNGTGGVANIVSQGSATWPLRTDETNPNRDVIWTSGDDGYVYEVRLDGNASSTSLVASRTVRGYSDAEISVLGTSFGTRYIEQPTGAQVIVAGNGSILTVASDGSTVYQKRWSGTIATPPAYLYLDSRVVEDVDDAYQRWTEAGNTSFYGERQTPKVAARDTNGLLEFDRNLSALRPGYYELTVDSGNLGNPDVDFDGFSVEITVDATVLQKRLLVGQKGHNVRGTDKFEFYVDDTVNGEWVLSFRWTNAFADPVKNTFRRLAIYGYSLRRIETELYRVNTGVSALEITKLSTSGTYDGSTPGGWLVALNSYGSIVQYRHESQVYPSNDTVTSKVPLSSLLTSATNARREDILFRESVTGVSDYVLSEPATLVLPSFGTVSEALDIAPLFLWAGGYQPELGQAKVAAKMSQQTAAVRVAYAPAAQWPAGALFTDYSVANTDNNNVAKFTLESLAPDTRYYYATANGTVVNYSTIGTLTTWGTVPFNFSFVATACVENRDAVGGGYNGTIFNTIKALSPRLFLNIGDFNYNESFTAADYNHSYDLPFTTTLQAALLRSCAVDWTWDDHDFGSNDSDRSHIGQAEAFKAYRRYAPHYPLPAGDDMPIYHAFTVGNCRFICTDLRSFSDPSNNVDTAAKTKMGRAQKAWFKQELLRAKGNYGVIFWINTDPWISVASLNDDDWGAYTVERAELAQFIYDNGIKGIFLISGDMHSQAIDDGRNSKYALSAPDPETPYVTTVGTAVGGLPLFHVAPLHQTSSTKGGPYWKGPNPSSGAAYTDRFGVITVTVESGQTYVGFSARDASGTVVSNLFHTFNGTESPNNT